MYAQTRFICIAVTSFFAKEPIMKPQKLPANPIRDIMDTQCSKSVNELASNPKYGNETQELIIGYKQNVKTDAVQLAK